MSLVLPLVGLVALALAYQLLQGAWRPALALVLLLGFLQDPLRKALVGQPPLTVGLVLVAAGACALVLLLQRGGLELPLLQAPLPALGQWLPLYGVLLVLQGLHGLVRFGQPLLSLIGVGFYGAPLLGLWLGFEVASEPPLLQRLLRLYVLLSIPAAFGVWLSYRGVDHPLLREVGSGILIHFRPGLSLQGACGFWRSSEVAAWHLGAAACLALVLATVAQRRAAVLAYGALALLFAALTLLTGRRKAQVLVLLFVLLDALLLNRWLRAPWRGWLLGNLLTLAGLSALVGVLVLPRLDFPALVPYLQRSLSAQGELWDRFAALGLGATSRALELAGLFGFGAGAAAQTGTLDFGRSRLLGSSLAYVSESGSGKLLTELGLLGVGLLAVGLVLLLELVRRNLTLLEGLPQSAIHLHVGLLAFALANLPFFVAASGIYGDPFVLLLLSLSFGALLAVPLLVAQGQHLQLSGRTDAAGVRS
ncbi:MAG: hypothetical protein VKL97_00980 [Cyanobacteriota bacterium]|nr:hypothetical protein [Cyanobacteriota bacterium]